MSQLFKGAGVALVTPFKTNGEVDFDALDTIIENQVAGGMDYLVTLGTTGEPPTLSSEEKQEVVKHAQNNSGYLPVVVGMGGNDTSSIIKQIENTDLNGISALLIVTPYYNKPTQEGMFRHYSEIAKVSPIPIILYNVPSRTGVNLEAETVVRLAEASDKIVALKEASGIHSQITKIAKNTPENFTIVSGDDVLAITIASIGGQGVISVIANALPGMVSQLIHSAVGGNFSEARKIHYQLIELFQLMFKEGNPGGVKALLNIQGIIENELRLPLYKISDELYNEIKEAYQRLK